MPAESHRPTTDDDPDPQILWAWVGRAVRPHLGWILMGAAALLLLLGYLGVSREAIPAKQIPYLVSGGIGGVFLAVLGAYFLGTQALRDDSGRLDRLERMVDELHAALLTRPDAPALEATLEPAGLDVATETPSLNGRGPARRVAVVEGGELFHRPSCALVAGKDVGTSTPGAARRQGLRPCPACTPVPATATA